MCETWNCVGMHCELANKCRAYWTGFSSVRRREVSDADSDECVPWAREGGGQRREMSQSALMRDERGPTRSNSLVEAFSKSGDGDWWLDGLPLGKGDAGHPGE
jgi:hypothetical protein